MKNGKLLALLLALVLLTASLPSALAEITYTGESPISEEPLTISILTHPAGSGRIDWQDMEWIQELLRRANVVLEMELIDNSVYADTAKTRLAAAVDLPDIVRLPGNDSDMTYIQSGIFVDLTEYYDLYGYNLNKLFATETHSAIKSKITTPEGSIFYVPSFNPVNSIRGIMINEPWLEQLGMAAPTNMDEFYTMLIAFKENDMNGNGDTKDEVPLFMRSGMTQLFGMYWGLDLMVGWRADDEHVISCSYAVPEYYEFLQYFNKLYSEGLLYNEFAAANLDTQRALFAENQIGTILHFLTNLTSYSYAIDPAFDVSKQSMIMQTYDAPVGPYGHQEYYGNTLLGTYYGITRDCENPEAVFCFLDYMMGDEATNLLWFGIEGIDYTLADDGAFVFSEQYMADQDFYRARQGYNQRALPDNKIAQITVLTEPEQTQKMYEIAMPYLKSPTIDFCYTLPEETEITSMYRTDIKTYFDEMFTSFITGTVPLTEAEFDRYLANLEALHVDELTAVYQAQYDRSR